MAGTPKNSLKTGSTAWILGLSVLLFAATWIFGALLQGHADRAEHWYFLSVYRLFRISWDAALAWSPVPFIYLWIGLVVIYLAWLARLLWKRRWIRVMALSIFLIAIHVSWFYWTWGFNYHRAALSSRWSLETSIRQDQFLNELAEQTRFIDSFRRQHAGEINVPERDPVLLEVQIRELLSRLNDQHGFPDFKGVRCRDLHPSGFLLIWSTSGVYLPFTGESQMDAGLHRLSKPFTMAHELAHGMGWTDEGECNFLAYLACSMSEDPYIRYASELSYWRYLLSHAARYEPETFKQIRAGMHPDVYRDLSDIDAANNRYPELVPAFREWFYDWYLKKHGIASGDRSYSEIVRLVIAYRQRQSTLLQ